jgi:ERCC4-type nuclease
MLELNIKILFTQTKEQTAEFILLLAGQKSFSSEETFSPLSRRPKEKTLSQIQVELLSEIPLIGKRKATLLLHKFGTLQNIFEAETKELQVLPGFGERTAEKIKEVFSK